MTTANSCIPRQTIEDERKRQGLMLFIQTYGNRIYARQVTGKQLPASGIQTNPDYWIIVIDGFPDPDVVPTETITRQ